MLIYYTMHGGKPGTRAIVIFVNRYGRSYICSFIRYNRSRFVLVIFVNILLSSMVRLDATIITICTYILAAYNVKHV